MSKQVIYGSFIPRLLAITLDLALLSIILHPIFSYLSIYIFKYFFANFISLQQITITDAQSINNAVLTPEFRNYISASIFIQYVAISSLVNMVLSAIYFVSFWYYFAATPGKMLLRLKIVNDHDYQSKPNVTNLILRYIGYIFVALSFWVMLFSSKRQAIHDKMAGTVVIKS